MKDNVLCPACGDLVLHAAGRPAVFTCPRCLSPLENPFSAASAVRRPLLVIPLEREVQRDQYASNGTIVATVVLLAVGIFAVLVAGGGRRLQFVLVLAMVTCAAG
jgi:hypothetical protein